MSPQAGRERPYQRLTTLQTAIVGLLLAAIGVGFLYLGSGDSPTWWQEHKPFQSVIRDLGSLLLVSTALGGLWELVGKRAFAKEVLESARTSGDVEAAGLLRIGTSYLDDPDWETLFRETDKLDIFVAYASTWRNANFSRLQELAARPDSRIRVILADPEDDFTIQTLSHRFNYSHESMRERIVETASAFVNMRVVNGGKIEIYYYPGDRLFSCYRFDSKAVITLYNHEGNRSATVPNIVVNRRGSIYSFLNGEIDGALRQSRSGEPG